MIKGESFSGVEFAVSMLDRLSLVEGFIAMVTSTEEEALAPCLLTWLDLILFSVEETMACTPPFFFGSFDSEDAVVAVGSGFFSGDGSGLFFAASRRSSIFCFDFACFFFRVGLMPRKSPSKPYAPPIVVRLDVFGVLEFLRGDGAEVFSLPGRDGTAGRLLRAPSLRDDLPNGCLFCFVAVGMVPLLTSVGLSFDGVHSASKYGMFLPWCES